VWNRRYNRAATEETARSNFVRVTSDISATSFDTVTTDFCILWVLRFEQRIIENSVFWDVALRSSKGRWFPAFQSNDRIHPFTFRRSVVHEEWPLTFWWNKRCSFETSETTSQTTQCHIPQTRIPAVLLPHKTYLNKRGIKFATETSKGKVLLGVNFRIQLTLHHRAFFYSRHASFRFTESLDFKQPTTETTWNKTCSTYTRLPGIHVWN
jgi:hypothetical protein